MKVTFAQTTYQEVAEKRKQALKKSHSLQGTKELTMQIILKRIPILICFLIYADFIFGKCFCSTAMIIYDWLMAKGMTEVAKEFAIPLFSLCGSTIVVVLMLVIFYKIIFWSAKNVLPLKTPICDEEYKNECFWRESEKVEDTLMIMNEISKLSPDDIAFSDLIVEIGTNKITLMLKDSKMGVIIKQTYSISHEVMMKKLEETGELDFSFIDEEWDAMLYKYEINDINKGM